MKKQYWILNNGKEVTQEYEGTKKVGYIGCGQCFENQTMSIGTYIIFDDSKKDYRTELLMYLINREEEIIQIHHKERNQYINMLANKR